MLSDLFYCGIVAGGAMLGVGQLARAMPSGGDGDEELRSLAIILAARAEGLGVVAIVVGLAATFIAVDAGGTAAALMAVIPAAILGLPGLLMCRPAGRTGVHGTTTILMSFVAGLGLLVLVVAASVWLVEGGTGASDFDPLIGAMGIVGAAAAAGLGYLGSQSIAELAGAGTIGAAELDPAAIRSRAMMRSSILMAVGVGTVIVAMFVLFTAE